MSRLAPQATDFPQWYLDVIAQAGLAEHADVKGCIIFKPYGYALWENIQKALDSATEFILYKNQNDSDVILREDFEQMVASVFKS